MFLLPFMTARTGSSEPKEEIKNSRLGQTSPERSFREPTKRKREICGADRPMRSRRARRRGPIMFTQGRRISGSAATTAAMSARETPALESRARTASGLEAVWRLELLSSSNGFPASLESGCRFERLLGRLVGLRWAEAAGGHEVVLEGEGGGRGGGEEARAVVVDGREQRGRGAEQREEVVSEVQHRGGAAGSGGGAVRRRWVRRSIFVAWLHTN